MDVKMKYGSGHVVFNVPDERLAAVVRPQRPPVPNHPQRQLAKTLSPQLDSATRDCSGRDVLVLLPDGTRTLPHGPVYAALASLLTKARGVRVLLATGTHKAHTPDNDRILDEIGAMSAEHAIPLTSAAAHDCNTSDLYLAGTTASGNDVWLNELVRAADTILIAADTAPHYFAGYSNALKFLLPGVAGFDSTERNHAWTLDVSSSACRHPLHPDASRRTNPVAEGQLDAARLVTAHTPVYALTTVSSGANVCWATFGPLEESVSDGIRFVDSCLVRRVDRRFRRAVIGCGGYPNDETLYIAQRSLELTREAIADDAEILWLAECRNGIASSRHAIDSFFTPLKRNAAAYIEQVRKKYVMYAHKTVRFVELMDRLTALHVVSALPAGTFPAGRMTACADPQEIVARWVEEGETILFVDEANKLAIQGPTPGETA